MRQPGDDVLGLEQPVVDLFPPGRELLAQPLDVLPPLGERRLSIVQLRLPQLGDELAHGFLQVPDDRHVRETVL